MSDAHNALITEFYSAFQRLDAEAMAACYTDDVVFSDPAFGELRGRDAGDMWRMLTTRAKDFSLTFDNVRSEVEQSFDLHAAAGTRLGGVHLELTGEDVTECTGGARELTDADLERAYRSTVDPRLNYEQSLEIAMCIVRKQNQLATPATR